MLRGMSQMRGGAQRSLGLTPSRKSVAPEGARGFLGEPTQHSAASEACPERSRRVLGYPLPPWPHAARKTSARRQRGSGLERGREQRSGLSQEKIASPTRSTGAIE